jgi:hypothetical protein
LYFLMGMAYIQIPWAVGGFTPPQADTTANAENRGGWVWIFGIS